jgi:CoA-transferase family III
MTDLLPTPWDALGGDPVDLRRLTLTGPPATLASTFPVTDAGVAAVGASLLAATTTEDVGLDTRQLAVALRSERYLLRDGRSPGSPFDPLSAFHRTADGWLRLHANYAWHRAAALRVLACSEREAPAAIAEWKAVELEAAVHDAGGVAAAVRTEAQWREAAGPPPPLVERRVLGDAAARPARRPRVLDLTRVIAGPVATRTLAAHGADVLRLDAPDRPEIPLQYWDVLPGKRSALLDLAARR